MADTDFKFPDELENEGKPEAEANQQQADEIEIDIEDDTPEEDRGRKPVNPEEVKKLEIEVDEVDKYSKDAKDKIIRMKRIWNDERRAREAAERERIAALEAAQLLNQQLQRANQLLASGEKDYKDTKKKAAKAELKAAEQAYKEAYEAGDSERMLRAQQELIRAQTNLETVKKFKLPSLQQDQFNVQTQPQQVQQPSVPRPDDRVMRWQEQNAWFGQDKVMTATALGVHEDLRDRGVKIGSEEYYAALDQTMRKRFPDHFDDQEFEEAKPEKTTSKAKPATVVAPATRSTAPKRVRLTQSQVAIAKKLGITPEQYVREVLKLGA
jgi:hypothetical protein